LINSFIFLALSKKLLISYLFVDLSLNYLLLYLVISYYWSFIYVVNILDIDAAQIQISKSKSQITKCQIPNPKFNLICQIPNPKSQIQVPNLKSQIILDLGSIYNLGYISICLRFEVYGM
jgi:hypothetical protein